MKHSNKKLILLFSAILAVCVLVLLIRSQVSDGTVASIYQDGTLLKQIDLGAVTTPYEIELEGNTIWVEHNGISVIEADCPDHLCVDQGTISSSGIPLVCLPNRLVITIKNSETPAVDAVSGR